MIQPLPTFTVFINPGAGPENRSMTTLKVVAGPGLVNVKNSKGWPPIVGEIDDALWAEMGGAVEPRPHATAPSARCRKGRKRVSLRVFIMNLRFERFCLASPSGTAVMAFYADGATLGGVRLTHTLAVIEVSWVSVRIPEVGRP